MHIFKFYGYSKIASPKDPTHLCLILQGGTASLRPGLTLQGSRRLGPGACPSTRVPKEHGAIVTDPLQAAPTPPHPRPNIQHSEGSGISRNDLLAGVLLGISV